MVSTRTAKWSSKSEKYWTKELAAMNLWTSATAAQLTQRLPVNLFQISVVAGAETAFINFERAVGTLRPNRMVAPL